MDAVKKNDKNIKLCKWCGKPILELDAPNQQYHKEQCSKEAEKEKRRARDIKHYSKNKMKKILRPGTTTIGTKPHQSLDREKEIIGNETIRTLGKPKSVGTVYKGKYSYSKGNIKFTNNNNTDPNHNNKPPIGIQLTHNYINLDDYVKYSTSLIMDQHIIFCPICDVGRIKKDYIRCEQYCDLCGTVVIGPYGDTTFKYPFMEYPAETIKEEPIDPMSYYKKEVIEPKKKEYKRPIKTVVHVFCKHCFKPYSIHYYKKEDFRCECGGKVVGVGICLPRDYNDEFTPRSTERKNKNYSELGKSDYDMVNPDP